MSNHTPSELKACTRCGRRRTVKNKRPGGDLCADCRQLQTLDRSTDEEKRGNAALKAAQEFATIVRNQDVDQTAAWLSRCNRATLEAVTVALAAMHPLDQQPAELLDWIDAAPTTPDARTLPGIPEDVRAGHSAFIRAKSYGIDPTPEIAALEQRYQSLRYRMRLNKRRAAA